jgi:hypothetical protein
MDAYTLVIFLIVIFLVSVVAIVIYNAQNPSTKYDEKDGLNNRFVSVSKHDADIEKSLQEDSKLHARIDESLKNSFDGNYDNLKNKPNLFDGDYEKLKNKPNINRDDLSDYNKLINKPDLFNGQYDSLIGKPLLFDGNWSNLHHVPSLFNTSWEKIENKPHRYPTDWNKIDGKPDRYHTNWDMIYGKPIKYDTTWGQVEGKPDKFDTTWGHVEGKPDKFDTTWGQVEGKPDKFDTTWDQVENKPNKFDTTWGQIDGKPDKFPTKWDMIEGKPVTGQAAIDDWAENELKLLLDEKASAVHTHNISEIQGFNPSDYALSNHNHAYENITGLSTELDKKQNSLTAGDNIIISSGKISALHPNLEPYAKKSEVTSDIKTKEEGILQKIDKKQNKLTAGANITINNTNTISASHPNLSGYATKASLNDYATKTSLNNTQSSLNTTNRNLNAKQNKLTTSTDISVRNITASKINGVTKGQLQQLIHLQSKLNSKLENNNKSLLYTMRVSPIWLEYKKGNQDNEKQHWHFRLPDNWKYMKVVSIRPDLIVNIYRGNNKYDYIYRYNKTKGSISSVSLRDIGGGVADLHFWTFDNWGYHAPYSSYLHVYYTK